MVRLVRIRRTEIYNNLQCDKLFPKNFKNNIRNLKILSFMSCQFAFFLLFFTFLTFFVKSGAFGCGKFAAFQWYGSVQICRTVPHRTAPYRTVPHRTAPHRLKKWWCVHRNQIFSCTTHLNNWPIMQNDIPLHVVVMRAVCII